MPSPNGFRLGWENEQLARYLLSRVSFVAQPATVSDDFGADFYCTLFGMTIYPAKGKRKPRSVMEPRNSFAIQVKSNKKDIDVSRKIHCFESLAMPFLVGVINQSTNSLRIYSAECLPMLFAWKGHPNKLILRLSDDLAGLQSPDNSVTVLDSEAKKPSQFRLRCGYVCTLTTGEHREELDGLRRQLGNLCLRASKNIAAKRQNENLYHWPDTTPTAYGGQGSVIYFRHRVMERIVEAFVNLKWIAENRPNEFAASEFKAYEDVLDELKRFHPTGATGWADDARIQAREFIEGLGLLKDIELETPPAA